MNLNKKIANFQNSVHTIQIQMLDQLQLNVCSFSQTGLMNSWTNSWKNIYAIQLLIELLNKTSWANSGMNSNTKVLLHPLWFKQEFKNNYYRWRKIVIYLKNKHLRRKSNTWMILLAWIWPFFQGNIENWVGEDYHQSKNADWKSEQSIECCWSLKWC